MFNEYKNPLTRFRYSFAADDDPNKGAGGGEGGKGAGDGAQKDDEFKVKIQELENSLSDRDGVIADLQSTVEQLKRLTTDPEFQEYVANKGKKKTSASDEDFDAEGASHGELIKRVVKLVDEKLEGVMKPLKDEFNRRIAGTEFLGLKTAARIEIREAKELLDEKFGAGTFEKYRLEASKISTANPELTVMDCLEKAMQKDLGADAKKFRELKDKGYTGDKGEGPSRSAVRREKMSPKDASEKAWEEVGAGKVIREE